MKISLVAPVITGALLATPTVAQESLPFPPTPSASRPGLTIKDSTL